LRGALKQRLDIEVFTDFDATISYEDLGDELFLRYGQIEPFRTQAINKEIDAKEYWRAICATLQPNVDLEFVKNFALEYQIDPYFKTFIDFCNTNDIDVSIISDGFTQYISPILERENINHIKVYCNELKCDGDKLIPHYSGASESCTCFCASCKRNAMLNHSEGEKIIIYIGDGITDFCAAEHADVIFAKKELAAYCNKNRIPHYTFKSFFDILQIVKKSVEENSFRIRRQAELKRKKAFEVE
jgi:2-hydroxy-3-keto-5-methylthiopentenyl-1-phosphate phosphatase